MNRQKIEKACKKLNLKIKKLFFQQEHDYNDSIGEVFCCGGDWHLLLDNGKEFTTDGDAYEMGIDQRVDEMIECINNMYRRN